MTLNSHKCIPLTAWFGDAQAFDTETNHAFAVSGENGELLTLVRVRYVPGAGRSKGYQDYFTETYRRTCSYGNESSQELACTWEPYARSKLPALPTLDFTCRSFSVLLLVPHL